jgi:hypothetical protein
MAAFFTPNKKNNPGVAGAYGLKIAYRLAICQIGVTVNTKWISRVDLIHPRHLAAV